MIVPNNFWLFLLLLCALLIFLEIASYSNSDGGTSKITLRPKVQPEKHLKTNQVTNVHKRKQILYWTPYFKAQDWQFGFGSKPFQNCPQPNCAGEKWNKYVFKPGLMSHFWNLSRLHHFDKIILSDQQGEGWKFRRNSLPLFLFKSFGWRWYGSIKGDTLSNGCSFAFIDCLFLPSFEASPLLSLVCDLVCDLDIICILYQCERVPSKRSGGRTRCMFLYQKNHRHTTSTGNGKSKPVCCSVLWLLLIAIFWIPNI